MPFNAYLHLNGATYRLPGSFQSSNDPTLVRIAAELGDVAPVKIDVMIQGTQTTLTVRPSLAASIGTFVTIVGSDSVEPFDVL